MITHLCPGRVLVVEHTGPTQCSVAAARACEYPEANSGNEVELALIQRP